MMKPRIPNKYRKYKHFNKNKFEKETLNKLSKSNKETFQIDEFKELSITTLNNHAPPKTKFLRVNHANFVSKELTKAIMLRSKLRNKYLLEKSEETGLLYKKHRNVRSIHRRCFVKKGVLKNSAKSTGKHLCQSLFFNKIAGLKACNFIKKETLTQVFFCEFCEISKNTFSKEHLGTTASEMFVFYY